MPGPYSPNHGVGTDGPPFTDPHPSQPIPPSRPTHDPPACEAAQAALPSAAYPGCCRHRCRTRNGAVAASSSGICRCRRDRSD